MTDVRPRPLILIIDDQENLLRLCERSLGDTMMFRRVGSGREAQEFLEGSFPVNTGDPEPSAGQVRAIFLDRDFSQTPRELLMGPPEDVRNEGLCILRWLRGRHRGIPVLMITGYRDQETAMHVTDLGADFLAWEDIIAQPAMLRGRIERLLEKNGYGTRTAVTPFRELGIVVDSDAFSQTLVLLRRAMEGKGPLLLLGETGTGKDTLAFAVHAMSGDSARPYVSVNVAALNPNLIESELFGHARGAFTGATQAGLGKLRAADGGTLLLNEIGDLPPEAQSKLLTALEQGEVTPVGDIRAYPARFRLISATSHDLPAMVQSGRFRRDLYHRIAWHTVRIPPLRERREDIPGLVRVFLRGLGQGQEGSVAGIGQEALEYLCRLPWNGNVRELRSVLEVAASISRFMITLGDVREVVESQVAIGTSRNEEIVEPARAGAAQEVLAGSAHGGPECERAVFGDLSYRDVTACYFAYLKRRFGDRLPEVARRAGIAKATAYEWNQRFRE